MSDRLPIFISYAHYDNESDDPEKRWLDRILQFLRPLELEDKISLWNDTKLQPGVNWRGEIQQAMEPARVAILLVSPAFLASEFIRSEELPRLLRGADPESEFQDGQDAESPLIIPILLRPCLIEHVAFTHVVPNSSEQVSSRLSDFQYVPSHCAMSGLSQHEQDEQLKIVAQRLIDAMEMSSPQPVPLPAVDAGALDGELERFLQQHGRWYFNALRIRNWGAKQPGHQALGNYTTAQVREGLERLEQGQRVKSKDGKRSRVYKIA